MLSKKCQLGYEACLEHIEKHYFEAVMYGNTFVTKNPVILINRDKYNTQKKFKGNGGVTFQQFANRYYNNPILIENKSVL